MNDRVASYILRNLKVIHVAEGYAWFHIAPEGKCGPGKETTERQTSDQQEGN